MNSALQSGNNQQQSYSMRKLQQKDRVGPASASEDDSKISMWLPAYSPMLDASGNPVQQPGHGGKSLEQMQSPQMNSGKEPTRQKTE